MTNPSAFTNLAFDRASIRAFDDDGHMHVTGTNISKAAVNPYRGAEIPDWEALGLDPDKTYKLLRDPDELKAAAASFNGKPLLFTHKPVTSVDHDFEGTVGSVANTRYEHPYLKADLALWHGPAIDAVKSGEQKELSSAYRYKAVMERGEYEGEPFDGRMTALKGNHVALVKEGRAGPDVVVGDSIEGMQNMTKAVLTRKAEMARGAIVAFLAPKLAQDAKIDWATTFKDVTAANFKDKKKAIAEDVLKRVKGKLAQDEAVDLEVVAKVLEAVADIVPEEPPLVDPVTDPVDPAVDTDMTALTEALKAAGFSEEDIAKIMAMKNAEPAADESEEDKKKREDDDKRKQAQDAEKMKDMVTKPAMDAALTAMREATARQIRQEQIDIRDAERAVRPWVGELAMSFDSADGVYRKALTIVGVQNVDKLHTDALRPILEAQPKPGDRPKARNSESMAQDAAAAKSASERFGTSRIGHAA